MPQNNPPASPTYDQLHKLWLSVCNQGESYREPPIAYARRVLDAFGQPPTPNPALPTNPPATPLESPQDQNPGAGKAGDDICLNGRLFLRELAETMGVLSPTDDPSETIPISEIMPKMLARAREDRERWHDGNNPPDSAEPLRSALSNLIGLIKLIETRPDVSRDLRDALTGSWHFREAVDALSDHDSTEARVK